jgi:hypothetical protein
MIKEVLGDRFLLVSAAIFMIISVLFSYFIYDYSAVGLAFGQPLSDQARLRAIAIALNDSWVQYEIYSVSTFNNLGPSQPRVIYSVRGVSRPSTFREIGRKVDRNRTLPAVEIVVGNESEKGTNILAYVDLAQGRVEYIGHRKRADANGQLPPEDYFDMSLPWTGYHEGDALSEEQMAKVVRLALEDKSVQEQMGGRNYSVMDDVIVTSGGVWRGDASYVGTYPHVTFTEGTPLDQPDFKIFVVVDMDRNKVLCSMMGVRTPIILDTPGNTSISS